MSFLNRNVLKTYKLLAIDCPMAGDLNVASQQMSRLEVRPDGDQHLARGGGPKRRGLLWPQIATIGSLV